MIKIATLKLLTATLMTTTMAAATTPDGCECDPCKCDPCNCGPTISNRCSVATYRNCCPTIDLCPWIAGIEMRGRFVLWKPSFDNLDYAYGSRNDPDNNVNTNHYKYVGHNWNAGFQLSLGRNDIACGIDLIASYAYIYGSDKNSVTSKLETLNPTQIINTTLGTLAQASSRHDFSYQSYDFLLSRCYILYACHRVTPLFGVAGLFLDQDTETRYDTVTNNMNHVVWHGEYSGIGFKMGARYDYSLNDCISFYFHGNGTILTGNIHNVTEQTTTGATPTKWKAEHHAFVPGYHVGVGFLYDFCWRGKAFNLIVGYEFLRWYNLPQQQRDNVWSQSHRQLGLHGIEMGCAFCF